MSVYSMTAFARESVSTPAALIVELRSVNHRYLDCHFKLPENLRGLESRLREALGKALKRGKVDCHIRTADANDERGLQVDAERLRALLQALEQIAAAAPQLSPPSTLDVLRFPGVSDSARADESVLEKQAFALFLTALDGLQANRAREGRELADFLSQRLDAIDAEVEQVRAALPALRERQNQRLRRRLEELDEPVDEGRVEQELVLALHKSDVDEELDRLEAHVREVRRVLDQGGPCGRRLDFLMQELNREANTLSSKSVAGSTTQSAVELKVLIEQMREQVQNIE